MFIGRGGQRGVRDRCTERKKRGGMVSQPLRPFLFGHIPEHLLPENIGYSAQASSAGLVTMTFKVAVTSG